MGREYLTEARKNLAELIRRNFSPSDIVVHLTYNIADDPGGSLARAEEDILEYIRYMEYLWNRHGVPHGTALRYIGITGTEKNGSREGSFRHYLILPGSLNPADIYSGWKKGTVKTSPLFDSKGKIYIVNRVTNKSQTYGTWYFAKCLEQTFDERDLEEENGQMIYLPSIDDNSGCLGEFIFCEI